jgi:hypothetical protein
VALGAMILSLGTLNMTNLKQLVLSLLARAAFIVTGGLATAAGPNGGTNPVETCGVGPTQDIVAIDQLWHA